MKQVARRLGRQRYLIIDATFYKRLWREQLAQLAGDEQLMLVQLGCSLESCLARNASRPNPIPERAVRIIYSEFQAPDQDLYIDTDQLSPDQAVELILRKISQSNGQARF